jgi:mannan endo-1,4-beta-mannosidase
MLQSFIKIFFNIVRYKLPFIAFLIVSFTLATLVYPFIQAHAAGYWRYTYIKRVGNILYQDSIPFRFSGMNIPWLGYDNSKGGEFPSKYRIEDAILTAKEMGATVIRSHTLGISVGCPTCIEPELNKFNGNEAFVSMDYALKFARDNRMRVIIPLTDNWRYFHGGKHTFTTWRGLSNEDEFYSNPQVIQDYKNYISYIVNHVNQFTGTRYKYDPTILAWETGNELDNASGPWNDAWTEEIAKHIKSVAPNHLVADGHISNYSTGRNLTQTQLELPSVDLYSGHFYPLRNDFIKRDAELAKQYNKVYFIGEYDWTDQNTQSAEATIDQECSLFCATYST